MKRFTLFLSLFLAFIGTATAQLPFTVSDAPTSEGWAANTTWYTIKNGAGNYLNGDVKDATTEALKITESTQPQENGYWCMVGDDTNGYKFYNYGTGKVLALNTTCNTGTSEWAAYNGSRGFLKTLDEATDLVTNFEFVASNKSGYWCIKQKGSEKMFIGANGAASNYLTFWNTMMAVYGWTPSGTPNPSGSGDDGYSFVFTKVNPENIVDIVYSYTDGVTTFKTENITATVGETFPAPNVPNYVNCIILDSEGTELTTVPANCNGSTFTINCSYDNNFLLQPGRKYGFYFPRDIRAYLKATESGQILTATAISPSTYNIIDEYTWIIGGDWYNGFTLQNKSNNKYLTAQSSGVNMVEELTNEAKYEIVWNSGNYYFKIKGTNNNYLSNTGGFFGTDKALSTWDSGNNIGDNGSKFTPVDITEYAIVANWRDPLLEGTGYVGGYSADKREELAALTTAAGCVTFMANNSPIELTNGYYRLYNVQRNGQNPTVQDYDGTIDLKGGAPDKQHVGQIIQITKASDGTVALYSPNAKKYLINSSARLQDDPCYFTLQNFGGVQYGFNANSGYLVLFSSNGYLGHWYAASKDGDGAWYIEPASDLEVALNTVGEASYASAYLPFPVQGSGIYTGAINAEKTAIEMTEQTGVLPAETGIVIKGAKDATSTTLTIGGTVSANVTGNCLRGTLTALTENLSNYLVLGKGNTYNGIGFFAPSDNLTTIAANKAYLLASDVTGTSPAIAMNFGGETTGVGTVITEEGIESNAPVFDLSGRRVMQTVKGGLYIQNGKKFIVK